ncbi:MAG: hypothetical protein LBP53_02195 [Candidatus Peribacteria bacterium]|nr:hypothetical protein [Candidatus Peribacteria bacterium]
MYKINTGAFVATTGTVKNGDSITLQLTSAPAYATTKTATLTLGIQTFTFSVSTKAQPASGGG